MKKTLITAALALGFASCASAAVVLDQSDLTTANGSYTIPSGTSIGTGFGNLAITMVLDADKFQQAITGGSLSSTNLFTAVGTAKIGIGLNTQNDGTGLYGIWQNGSATRGINTVSGVTTDLNNLQSTFTGTTYTSIALTYSLNGAGAHSHLTLVDSEGTTTTITGTEAGLKASGFGSLQSFTYSSDYVTYVSIEQTDSPTDWVGTSTNGIAAATTLNTNAIAAAKLANAPEPATATLSLLALAGLAARRRRK